MLGIKVEDLATIPAVMIIACGQEKAQSILPLLNNHYCSVLAIDQQLAEALI